MISKTLSRIQNFLRKRTVLRDVLGGSHEKRALLSYVTAPFLEPEHHRHTNYLEAWTMAKVLDGLGYSVDVQDFDFRGDVHNLHEYDLIMGFGDVFQHAFENNFSGKTVYYGMGMHEAYQNAMTLRRARDVQGRKGVWLAESCRFVKKTWTHQTAVSDLIIALGNHVCADSYRQFYDGPIASVPAPFLKFHDPHAIIAERSPDTHTSFLWFGGDGLIHKGLDLVLDYFAEHPDLELHACGPLETETRFAETFNDELSRPNVINHGFVDVSSDRFKEILSKVAFLIYPSCSEGGGAGALNAIGNGGLIPVITKQTTISTGNEIWIDGFDADHIQTAVDQALALSADTITQMQSKNADYVCQNHAEAVYASALQKAISRALEKKSS